MLKLLINLDRSTDRLNRMKDQLNKLGIEYSRIDAIDGSKLSDNQISQITYPLSHYESKFRFTRELTRGEIGCFLSHRKCWSELLRSNHRFALIMEDDIKISSCAAPYLCSTTWIPADVDICQLSSLKNQLRGKISPQIIEIDSNLKLVAPLLPPPLGCQCYIISKRAAKVALSLSEKLPAPVDDFLFTLWFDIANEFTIWRTAPTLVIPQQEVESEIGDRKQKVRKAPFFVRHGIKRILTDLKIKRIQKKGIPFTFEFKK